MNARKTPGICSRCGIQHLYNRWDSSGKFCSRSCFLEHQRQVRRWYPVQKDGYITRVIDIACLNCGQIHQASRATAKYCTAKCQLAFEYAHGIRDKATIAEAAHEAIRKFGQPKKRGVRMKPRSQAVYDKISATKLSNHAEYRKKHGLPEPAEKRQIVNSRAYRHWRLAVYERDRYTCVICGDNKGGNLEADHIKPRYLFPELTFDLDNGRTLCGACHKATPTYGARVTLLTRADFADS